MICKLKNILLPVFLFAIFLLIILTSCTNINLNQENESEADRMFDVLEAGNAIGLSFNLRNRSGVKLYYGNEFTIYRHSENGNLEAVKIPWQTNDPVNGDNINQYIDVNVVKGFAIA